MRIETKFNIGDSVAVKAEVIHTMNTLKVEEWKIFKVLAGANGSIAYLVTDPDAVPMDEWVFVREKELMFYRDVEKLRQAVRETASQF